MEISQLRNLPLDQMLEFLNDKLPSEFTDDPSIFLELGDFIKHEGEVMTCYEYQRRKYFGEM